MRDDLESRAQAARAPGDVGAGIGSGSVATDAIVVAPTAMKSLTVMARGFANNALQRAIDATSRKRRHLRPHRA